MKIVFVDVSYPRAVPQPPQPLLCVALDRTIVVQHRGALVELLEASTSSSSFHKVKPDRSASKKNSYLQFLYLL